MNAALHLPVMAAEVVAALAPADGEFFVDGTFGGGGYAQALLAAANCRVLGIDRDAQALAAGEALVTAHAGRLELLQGCFGEMDRLLAARQVMAVDGVALDLGVSSMQLDSAERGFSFRADGPLDMRMQATGETAAQVVNGAAETELVDLLRRYGEEPQARRIARAIVRARAERPIERTGQLAELVERAIGRGQRVHAATRTFQALRIHVNDELGELERGLGAAERLLRPGGRLAVVSFHSLEDRIVKRFLQPDRDHGSRHLPPRPGRPPPRFEPLFTGVRKPGAGELARNPRARSARLRAARRTAVPATMEKTACVP